MPFKKVSSFSIVVLIVALIFVQYVIAQHELVPPDVLEVRPGGYVYADYPGVFDNFEGDGITIEAWIYLMARPEDGAYTLPEVREGQWIIFAKPASYYVVIRGRNLLSALETHDPEGSSFVHFATAGQPTAKGVPGGGGTIVRLLPEEYPLSLWVHIAYQIGGSKHETNRMYYFDRKYFGKGHKSTAIGRTPAPLLIGGTPLVKFKEGAEWGDKYESMSGYIDEVRVSEGWRYGEGKVIQPKRHFSVDVQTIALWRFAEGPGATAYRDSSGNGYTLAAGGSLSVHPRDKVATTWGRIKRDTF